MLTNLNRVRKLYTATMAEGESILVFRNGVRTLSMTLQNMGVVLDEDKISTSVLNGVADRIHGFISAMDTVESTGAPFTMDFVRRRPLQEQQRMQDWASNTIGPVHDSALISRSSHGRPPSSSSSRRTPSSPCSYYNRPGHQSHHCFKKLLHLAPDKSTDLGM